MLARHFGAPGLQRGQALQTLVTELGGLGPGAGTGRLAGAGAAGFGEALAQHQAHLAAQHRARQLGELQGVESIDVDPYRADGNQLAEHAAPLLLAQVGTDAECGQLVVAELGDLLGGLAAQDVHDLAGAKADAAGLLDAVDAAEHLARGVTGIPYGGRVQAVVAVAAGAG